MPYSAEKADEDLTALCKSSGIVLSSEDREILAARIDAIVSNNLRDSNYEIERLTALVQLGLKIIEQGDSRCESDAAELKRFLNEASQL